MEGKGHTRCAGGETNSVDNSLVCKLGGYISVKHNSVRESEAQIIREVCKDVQIEPTSANQWKWIWKKGQYSWQCKVGYCCERVAEKLRENVLGHKDYTSNLSLILISPFHRSTNNMEMRRISTNKEWLTLRSPHLIPLSSQQVVRWHQSQQKTGWKNGWKVQGAICICHDLHQNIAHVCTFE